MAQKRKKRDFKQTLRLVETDKSVLEMAYERINHLYDLFDHVFVSFSGGKDSTVCLNLTLEVARERGKLPLRAVFYDEEVIASETVDYVRRVSQNPDISLEWYCIPLKLRNACSKKFPNWYPWGPEDKDRWARPLPPEAITEIEGFPVEPKEARLSLPECTALFAPASKFGTSAMIMGIRTQESMTRLRAVSRREKDNYIIGVKVGDWWGASKFEAPQLHKAYPIYDWTTEDVWEAPKKFGWDYNRAYDLMDKLGMAPHSQRISPAFGEEPMQKLWIFAHIFPDIWQTGCHRVPGAKTAARYGNTELYAFGEVPEKPADKTWEEFVLDQVKKFKPGEQELVAKRIKKVLNWHFGYKGMVDPLLGDSIHPVTGLSWKWVAMIAVRGDFKGRKAPRMVNFDNFDKVCEDYANEYFELTGETWKGKEHCRNLLIAGGVRQKNK